MSRTRQRRRSQSSYAWYVLPVEQNDPRELLEVLDARGAPTGQAKSRAAIHLDGDWHRAFHCWILRAGGAEVVLQRRSTAKDTFPGLWDASAAGHWRFGETPAEASREIGEELGVDVPFSSLRRRGAERSVRRHINGLIDRELHEVYVLDWDAPLSGYRPDPAEVAGVAAFPLRDLVDVVSGRRSEVAASEAVEVLPDGATRALGALTVRRENLVPYSASRLRRLKDGRVGIC